MTINSLFKSATINKNGTEFEVNVYSKFDVNASLKGGSYWKRTLNLECEIKSENYIYWKTIQFTKTDLTILRLATIILSSSGEIYFATVICENKAGEKTIRLVKAIEINEDLLSWQIIEKGNPKKITQLPYDIKQKSWDFFNYLFSIKLPKVVGSRKIKIINSREISPNSKKLAFFEIVFYRHSQTKRTYCYEIRNHDLNAFEREVFSVKHIDKVVEDHFIQKIYRKIIKDREEQGETLDEIKVYIQKNTNVQDILASIPEKEKISFLEKTLVDTVVLKLDLETTYKRVVHCDIRDQWTISGLFLDRGPNSNLKSDFIWRIEDKKTGECYQMDYIKTVLFSDKNYQTYYRSLKQYYEEMVAKSKHVDQLIRDVFDLELLHDVNQFKLFIQNASFDIKMDNNNIPYVVVKKTIFESDIHPGSFLGEGKSLITLMSGGESIKGIDYLSLAGHAYMVIERIEAGVYTKIKIDLVTNKKNPAFAELRTFPVNPSEKDSKSKYWIRSDEQVKELIDFTTEFIKKDQASDFQTILFSMWGNEKKLLFTFNTETEAKNKLQELESLDTTINPLFVKEENGNWKIYAKGLNCIWFLEWFLKKVQIEILLGKLGPFVSPNSSAKLNSEENWLRGMQEKAEKKLKLQEKEIEDKKRKELEDKKQKEKEEKDFKKRFDKVAERRKKEAEKQYGFVGTIYPSLAGHGVSGNLAKALLAAHPPPQQPLPKKKNFGTFR